MSPYEGLQYLAAAYPEGSIAVDRQWNKSREMLPAADRERVVRMAPEDAEFYIGYRLSLAFNGGLRPLPEAALYTRRIYNSTVMVVARYDDLRRQWAGEYQAVKAGELLASAKFDLYRQGDWLFYTKWPCMGRDTVERFALHLYPVQEADLPAERRQYGFDNRDFSFGEYGVRFDDKCLIKVPLPDYPIKEIRTGQFIPGEGLLWEVKLMGER